MTVGLAPTMTYGQSVAGTTPTESASVKKALLYSILLPGLGHKYVEGGRWTGWAVAYSAADVGLWLSLFGGEWQRSHLENSYTTLASRSSGAQLDGKDRTFYLNLASFESSDLYLETMLRNRAWDLIDYVRDPAFHWEWDSQRDFERFRDLRDDAESLRRRRSILIASLVANRLISGAIAARKATRTRRLSVSAALAPPIEDWPVFALRVGF